jgi:hypothetical protein
MALLTSQKNPIMSEINIGEIKTRLRDIIASFQKSPRGKFALLLPFRDEIFQLRKKGATLKNIAEILTQCKITEKEIKPDNISKYFARAKQPTRATTAKKTKLSKSA